MKRINHMSPRVQAKIVSEYRQKSPDGTGYLYTLKQIAAINEVSLSSVNNLARLNRVQGRPQGGRKLHAPSARTLKILRDATEPGATYAGVGRRNPRMLTIDGKRVVKPLTKQRVKQIIDFWSKRGNPGVRSRGFNPGDIIEWNDRQFTVLRFDDARKGSVQDHADQKVIDPFIWVYKGCRSRLVKPVPEKQAATL